MNYLFFSPGVYEYPPIGNDYREDFSPRCMFLHLPFQKLSSEHHQQHKLIGIIMTLSFLLNSLTVAMMLSSKIFTFPCRSPRLSFPHISDIHSPWGNSFPSDENNTRYYYMIWYNTRDRILADAQYSKKRIKMNFMPCALDFLNVHCRS